MFQLQHIGQNAFIEILTYLTNEEIDDEGADFRYVASDDVADRLLEVVGDESSYKKMAQCCLTSVFPTWHG